MYKHHSFASGPWFGHLMVDGRLNTFGIGFDIRFKRYGVGLWEVTALLTVGPLQLSCVVSHDKNKNY